ncbi:hypothetical protein DY000_02032401 [Brassica cretica]|uniref:Uncharacterized protein n=1 Tax=Brassica cretica TaxID=69181 RepID=A0ABQ7DHM6_BRACR|nr:hypothetical protein DY000_02032401 [Brassica cretica]
MCTARKSVKHGLVLSWVTRHGETHLDLIHVEGIKMASWMALERIRRDALASVRLWIRSSLLLAYSVHKTAHDSLCKDQTRPSFLLTKHVKLMIEIILGGKGVWRGLANLTPKLLVQEKISSGYKQNGVKSLAPIYSEERTGLLS